MNAFKPKWLAACAALILGLAGLPVHAQVSAFPSKPVRITSPFPTGLAVDVNISADIGTALAEPALRGRFRNWGSNP